MILAAGAAILEQWGQYFLRPAGELAQVGKKGRQRPGMQEQ
jgi:hypothetical protein